MKTFFRATLYFCSFSLFVLCFTSCDKNSDLVEEYVLSENLQEQKLDDPSVQNTAQRAVLDTKENDLFTD
ncbi:hypothetical protein FB2170_02070 [Maribacter sp. HTCC2170]|nr:hypothetical protein FB2170_02070 [Maribacter sp. HTCC2170]